jgi:hypothetical protein
VLRNKGIVAGLLAVTMLVAQVVSVAAAPFADIVTGTIQSCTTSTDAYTGAIIVVCTVTLADGSSQTVNLSATDAQTLGLATVNPDGSVTIIATAGQSVAIDTSMILANPCTLPNGSNQPVGAALTDFFCTNLGIGYSTVQTLHADGFGYGEITQACFMAQVLGLPGEYCQTILQDKQSGDYSNLTLPGGVTVSNWGQLMKAVFTKGQKNMFNLGAVMSGRANGNGNSNGHGNNGKGHSNGHSNNGH